MITSVLNTRVKHAAALHDRRAREEQKLCWVESRRCVALALGSAWRVREVALSASAGTDARRVADAAAQHGCPVQVYSDACFKKMSALRHSDGIGAVVETCVLSGPPPPDDTARTIVVWQLQDPGNLGSIIRSAVAMGCGRVAVVEPCVDVTHPLCVRATAGMLFMAGVWRLDEAGARAWLAAHAPQCAALSAHGGVPLPDALAHRPRILLVGNEARGVPDDLARALPCVAIPMAPGVESLNVNAAAAIALYTLWGAA